MSFLSVRPARHSDLDALLSLAKDSGTGMTTVPTTPEAMEDRISCSQRAFAGTGKAAAKDIFFFVLDDGERAVGMASIFPNLGEERPFYSYRRCRLAAHAPDLGIRTETDVLHLVNDYHGYTEIGTLLVGSAARGRGAGRLLSLSRLAYLGLAKDRFGEKVMAEIRGWFTEDNRSPFWDGLAAHFMPLSFKEADKLSARDFRFISDLMPSYPIYVALLPEAAREVINKPHETSQYAMRMLLAEGFENTGCIDIFDAGPSIEAPIDRIRTIACARRLHVRIGTETDEPKELVANPRPDDFTALIASGPVTDETVTVTAAQAERLGLEDGAEAMVTPLRSERKA